MPWIYAQDDDGCQGQGVEWMGFPAETHSQHEKGNHDVGADGGGWHAGDEYVHGQQNQREGFGFDRVNGQEVEKEEEDGGGQADMESADCEIWRLPLVRKSSMTSFGSDVLSPRSTEIIICVGMSFLAPCSDRMPATAWRHFSERASSRLLKCPFPDRLPSKALNRQAIPLLSSQERRSKAPGVRGGSIGIAMPRKVQCSPMDGEDVSGKRISSFSWLSSVSSHAVEV